MKVVKFAMAFAACFLIVLIILIVNSENPEIALYDKTVETLMIQKGFTSVHEVLECYPTLKEIKNKIDRIGQLQVAIQSKTQGPAPMITEPESIQVQKDIKKIHQLRSHVRLELEQLVAAQVLELP